MNQANSTKLIPYGMTDFPAIIRNNYYYVDKTEYIRQIEQTARFFFFVRPVVSGRVFSSICWNAIMIVRQKNNLMNCLAIYTWENILPQTATSILC